MNPQWQQHNPAYSSHYIQAYYPQQPLPQPYTVVPGPSNRQTRPAPSAQWYQPGNKRCMYKACTFTGSHVSVETHMMDRHLIYPPGWKKRQQKQDWDADPSLKGKPVPIQGTNVTLDDPEQLAAWIAERKKRFPTAGKVADKKRKMDEAVARGQLTAEDFGLPSDKRRKVDENNVKAASNSNSIPIRGTHSRRGGRGHGRGGLMLQRPPALLPQRPGDPLPATHSLPPRPVTLLADSSSDSEGEPEVETSRKEVESIAMPSERLEEASRAMQQEEMETSKEHGVQRQRRLPQPKKPSRNPFASRPSLLRNLIVPEIRMTISNLSQAIRFLVDNDFLRGVELKPGEANEVRIQVLES